MLSALDSCCVGVVLYAILSRTVMLIVSQSAREHYCLGASSRACWPPGLHIGGVQLWCQQQEDPCISACAPNFCFGRACARPPATRMNWKRTAAISSVETRTLRTFPCVCQATCHDTIVHAADGRWIWVGQTCASAPGGHTHHCSSSRLVSGVALRSVPCV